MTATSGDTGGASLSGFKDVDGVKLIVFYPNGKVSKLQEKQMLSFKSKNAKVIGFSSSLNSARIGTSKFDNVHIIDSQNLSSGTGLLVLKICKLRKEGKDASEVVDIINEMVPKVRSQFTIDTLNYLHKGGRCSGASKLFGTLLNIKKNHDDG